MHQHCRTVLCVYRIRQNQKIDAVFQRLESQQGPAEPARDLSRCTQVLGCAMVKPVGIDSQGKHVSELAAFCVHPSYRGSGRGDSLLEYCEQEALRSGVDRLVLLTTRTADWFEARGYMRAGPAHESDMLPDARRLQVGDHMHIDS